MFRRPILLILPILTLSDVDSYGAPSGPVYSPTPQSQYSAPATTYQATNAQLPNYDYYKHEHHHYYHAGPPKVVHVKVPVTQKPYVVQVPQNVPVQFVGVNVPTPAPPRVQVVQVQPQTGYSQPQHIHHYPGVSGGYQGGYQGYGYQDPGYVTRKELVKSGLLLGAGILKGALLTTAINAINNNNNNGK